MCQPGTLDEAARSGAQSCQAPARRCNPEFAGARRLEIHFVIRRSRHVAGGTPGLAAIDALRGRPRAGPHPRAVDGGGPLDEVEDVPPGERLCVGRPHVAPSVVVRPARLDGANLHFKRLAAREAVAQRMLGLVLGQLLAERREDRAQPRWRLGLHQADRLHLRAAWKISASATNVSGSPSDRGAAHDHGRRHWARPSLPRHAKELGSCATQKQTAARRLADRIRAHAPAMTPTR